MIPINILLSVVAAFLLLGMVGDNDRTKVQCFTVAFVAVVLLIAVLNA